MKYYNNAFKMLPGILFCLSIIYAQEISLHGTIYNNNNNKVSGVIVRLNKADIEDTTGADGEYHLVNSEASINNTIKQKSIKKDLKIADGWISFGIEKQSSHISIKAFNMLGRKLATSIERDLGKGNYKFGMGTLFQNAANSVYIILVSTGDKQYTRKFFYNGQSKYATGMKCEYDALSNSLKKQTQNETEDTLIFIKAGQIITSNEISQYIDTLSDLFVIQRNIGGEVLAANREIGNMKAIISGYNISESKPKEAPLQYFPGSLQYSGFIYSVYTVQQVEYSVYVQSYDTLDRFIGRSEDVVFGNNAGNIPVPVFNPVNALPIIEVSDTNAGINDNVILSATVIDSFGGTIEKYSWKCGDGEWFIAESGDTTVKAPSTAQTWICSLKVTDDDSNIVCGQKIVTVETREPNAIAGNDTTVGINDNVMLTGSGSSDETEIIEYSWKCGDGEWFVVASGDTIVTAPSTAQSWTCSLKVTDEDSNTVYDQKIVTVETRAPTADAGTHSPVGINDTIHLSGSGTDETSIVMYEWKIGASEWIQTSTGDTDVIAPATAQSYVCSLRVTDDDGNTNADAIAITVETRAPVAVAGNDTTVGINDDVILHGSGSTDETEIIEYAWKCGDGEWFVVESGDTIVTAPSTAQTWQCSLKVMDDDSNVVYDKKIVTVETRAPIAEAGNDTTVGINDSVKLIGSGSSDETNIIEYAWKCGDGQWFVVDNGDTIVTAPSSAQTWTCSLKVMDDDSNVVYDQKIVTTDTTNFTIDDFEDNNLTNNWGGLLYGLNDAPDGLSTINMYTLGTDTYNSSDYALKAVATIDSGTLAYQGFAGVACSMYPDCTTTRDLSMWDNISYAYKGPAHTFTVEISYENHWEYTVPASTTWTTVNPAWSDFTLASWAAGTLDRSSVQVISWIIQDSTGFNDSLYLDNIQLKR